MGDIDLGAAQLIAFDVTDETGALANASNVTLTVTSPDGVTDYVPVTNPPDVTGAVPAHLPPRQRRALRMGCGHHRPQHRVRRHV